MIEFKRTQTHFEGGDLPRHIHDRMGRTDFVPAQTVTIVKVADEEEDTFRIRTADGSEYIVDGCDLSPHPASPETNEEFLARLMQWSDNGPLMQGFIMEALRIYSEQVITMPDDQRASMDRGFIAYSAWESYAKEVLAEQAKKFDSGR